MGTACEIAANRSPVSIARAIETLRFTVARFPGHAPAWAMMADDGAALAAYGELSASVGAAQISECCEKALAADPLNAGALAVSGWSLAMLEGRRDEGARRVDGAIRRKPEWRSLFWRAWLRVDRRDLDGALADIEAALSLSPLERVLLSFRAWLTFCQGRFEEADTLARDAQTLRGDVVDLLSVRAVIACERGDPRRGVEHAERAADSNDPSRILLSHLAYAYARAGEAARARRAMAAIGARPNGHAATFLIAPLVALGELEEAKRRTRQAEEERCPWRAFAWCDPRLELLRRSAQDPRSYRPRPLAPRREHALPCIGPGRPIWRAHDQETRLRPSRQAVDDSG